MTRRVLITYGIERRRCHLDEGLTAQPPARRLTGMGAPALFILDGQVGELAAQLSSDGVVAIERTPPEGDLAVLYIDCSIGQVGLTLCFQPMARYGREGWHIISFARGEGGRAEVLSLFEKLWDRLKDIGAREDLPSDLAPN